MSFVQVGSDRKLVKATYLSCNEASKNLYRLNT